VQSLVLRKCTRENITLLSKLLYLSLKRGNAVLCSVALRRYQMKTGIGAPMRERNSQRPAELLGQVPKLLDLDVQRRLDPIGARQDEQSLGMLEVPTGNHHADPLGLHRVHEVSDHGFADDPAAQAGEVENPVELIVEERRCNGRRRIS